MYRKDVNESSPLRILERSIHGGLGKGNLGVVMAPAGVGKTAFLVQVGLDEAMREGAVLHVTTAQSLEHLHAWYDALFDDLAAAYQLEEREAVRAMVARNRVLQAYGEPQQLTAARLEKLVELYAASANFKPTMIVLDGYLWHAGAEPRVAELSAFKELAKSLQAELWLAAPTEAGIMAQSDGRLSSSYAPFAALIDVAIGLTPQAGSVMVRLLKDHSAPQVSDIHLHLDADTLRLVGDDATAQRQKSVRLPTSAYTLLSGGAPGAEAAFGEAAEKFGLNEVTFSFAGRPVERHVGLVELSEAELERGHVSAAYVESHLHRSLPRTPTFQKLLQTLWHQVVTAGEVFSVGVIQPDNTVKGGTGWAVELARHFKKPVHVFDQERGGWFVWREGRWVEPTGPVVISRRRFCGTGTRFLTGSGRAAIENLFAQSFPGERSS